MLKRSELEFWTSTPKDVIKQVDQHYKFLHGSDNKEKKVTNNKDNFFLKLY